MRDLKSLKASELPKGTVIEERMYGEWFKDTDTLWLEMFARDAPHKVSDDTSNPNDYMLLPSKSDDFFKEFTIISLPVGWTD